MKNMLDRWAPLLVLLLGALLYLPGIGSFGLWDPHEVRIADAAKEVALSEGWEVRGAPRPPLPVWLVAAGFRLFGIGEVGGRLPVALASIAALLICYALGAALFGRRAGLLGAVALATSPAFFLSARQLTTQIMPVLGPLCVVAGLARALWAPSRTWPLDLLLGLAGLAIGQLASGTLLGVAVPLAAIAVALLLCGGGRTAVRAGLVTLAGGLLVAVAWSWYQQLNPGAGHVSAYTALLGGTPHAMTHQTQLVSVVTQIGFGFFPWVALLPWSVARAFVVEGELRPGWVVLIAWAGLAYLATLLQLAGVGEVAFAAGPAIALLVGALLDETLEQRQSLALVGLTAALGAVLLGHDFFLNPERFGGAHVLEGIKWPSPLEAAPYVVLGAGLVWGAFIALGHLLLPRPGWFSRQGALAAAFAAALGFAAASSFWIVPSVSQHLSYKGLFTKYRSLGGSELGQYRVPGHGASYYNAGKTVDLSSLPQLFEFLAKPARVFVIVSSEDVAPIDQFAKSRSEGSANYFVVDDSNAHFLLLSNRLGTGESDLSPLRRQIVRELLHPPQHELHVDFEGKVELVGYDLPDELSRGQSFKITLYYKVIAPLGGAYKVFLHFDGPGTRFNGDHIPLEGRFPTNYWVPGFYIIDEHRMEPDRATSPIGNYQIFGGLFMGERRLKIASGPSDGDNRARLGGVRVK